MCMQCDLLVTPDVSRDWLARTVIGNRIYFKKVTTNSIVVLYIYIYIYSICALIKGGYMAGYSNKHVKSMHAGAAQSPYRHRRMRHLRTHDAWYVYIYIYLGIYIYHASYVYTIHITES